MISAWTQKCFALRKGNSETLADLLEPAMQLAPDKVAVYYEDRTITFRELDQAANRVANGLIELGVNSGDRVAIHVDNRPEFIAIFLGVMRAGAVLVPTNVMYKAEGMERILEDSGARLLFVYSSLSAKLEDVLLRLPSLEVVIEVGPRKLDVSVAFEEFLRDQDASRPGVAIDPTKVAIIQYTSGTTGNPKGAMVSHKNVLSALDSVSDMPGSIDFDEDDTLLLVLPLFHAYALDLCLEIPFMRALSIVLMKRFKAEEVFSLFEKHKVTFFYGAPPMYHAFVNTPGLEQYDVSSLKAVYSGAAPLPVVVLERFREMTGLQVIEGYGLSESAPTLTTNSAGEVPKPGSVGPSIPGVKLRLVDENDQDVPPGEVGEIVAQGPNIFLGYWNKEEETAKAKCNGWFHTGDMGRMDEDGYYYIVDRKKDMINVSGYNVYPIDVENVIMRHPQIMDCAVIGIPDDYQGESVKACVVLNPSESMEAGDVVAYCREHLAAFKVPRHVAFREALPKSPTGKILKRILRDEEAKHGK